MSHFDPFDPNNRDRRKRRSKAEVALERSSWRNDLDGAFKTALEAVGLPDYVQGDLLLEDALAYHFNYYALRRNMTESLRRLGYEFFVNPTAKDGRWKGCGKIVTVYKKAGAPLLSKSALKKFMEW